MLKFIKKTKQKQKPETGENNLQAPRRVICASTSSISTTG